MSIQLTTTPDAVPFDVLDTLVKTRRRDGQSWLLVQVSCRREQRETPLQMPGLSWYDAHRLRQFADRMAQPGPVGICRVVLPDAGVQLTGSPATAGPLPIGTQVADAARRLIRVESLPGAARPFAPFVLTGSRADIGQQAGRLSQRMWEAFLQQ
jgi:hypothetical protein